MRAFGRGVSCKLVTEVSHANRDRGVSCRYELSVEAFLVGRLEQWCGREAMAALFRSIRHACWDCSLEPEAGGALVKMPAVTEEERAARRRASEEALSHLFVKGPLPMLLSRPGCLQAARSLAALVHI